MSTPISKIKEWANTIPGEKEIEAQESRERAQRMALAARPFDPRTEVSADAKYIVKNLLLWFLLPPLLAVLIYVVVRQLS